MKSKKDEWYIYEILKGNRKLDMDWLRRYSKKKDLVNAIIWYVSKNVEYNTRTNDKRENK